ncbi:MAG: hypothetical protein NC181_01325 [Clostridium sp.]|nr:hypothetical protein [Clostridium sp.]MCM1443981.1 hypothetical protein [Candidatus Amulumruptor caecigallinarius]
MAKKKNNNTVWIIKIIFLAFVISVAFSFISDLVLSSTGVIIGIIILIVFILLGVIFDMIGVAITASDEKPIHSMNSRKVKGATVAVILKKNAAKVSSFCNDVVGDICGIISGSAGIVIATSLSNILNINLLYINLVVTGIIASLTIGGKAIGKEIAIKKSNDITYVFAKVISCFYKVKNK